MVSTYIAYIGSKICSSSKDELRRLKCLKVIYLYKSKNNIKYEPICWKGLQTGRAFIALLYLQQTLLGNSKLEVVKQ